MERYNNDGVNTMDRRTKIVATIGPASMKDDKIRHLLKSGMNIARLNLSHGTHEEHTMVFDRLRTAAREMEIPLCILLDLQGPKIRIANLPDGEMDLNKGQKVTLTTRISSLDADEIPVDFLELPRSVQKGERIRVGDGNLELRVESIEVDRVIAQV